MSKDTVLAYEAMGNVEDPPVVDTPLQVLEQVLVPDELCTGRGVVRVGPHLALKRKCQVVGVTEEGGGKRWGEEERW